MAELIIKDGTGDGFRVAVTPESRLLTQSKAISQVSQETLDGNQFIAPVGRRSITTVDTEYASLYLNPNDPEKQFSAQRFSITVKEEEPILFRLYLGSAVPTANNVEFALGNTNTNSTNKASITAHVWNGVGTGMTVASMGTEAFAGYFTRGFTDVEVAGAQIWGFGAAVLITAECAAANAYATVVTGWESVVE